MKGRTTGRTQKRRTPINSLLTRKMHIQYPPYRRAERNVD